MIRSQHLTRAQLDAWLVAQQVPNPHRRYRLRVWREDQGALAEIQAELDVYLDEAFADVRQTLRRGFDDSLSPFNDPPHDPAANYPQLLHRITLQGYFGEVLGVVAVEHWGAHGHTDWVVPAFLFRFHNQEFQHLELINERLRAGQAHNPDAQAEIRPGRTGDDGLAFRMNAENVITDVLTLEAKCVGQNRPEKIAEAHEKLNAGSQRPTGVRELVNLLSEYDTPSANLWHEALLRLWHDGYRAITRYDGIAYACGQIPRQRRRISWMASDGPHPVYTVTRHLEGMEFQFGDLDAVIDTLFRR